MTRLSGNERSWAVDVISAINEYAAIHQLEIRRAGGEHTLKQKGENSLFPDVILFGDQTATRVRHGWEMKFPDTPVDDPETVANAARKATRLGVNSFLIWNVDRAQLHVSGEHGDWPAIKTWGPIGARKRADVAALGKEWRALLKTILGDLNRYFARGTLLSAAPAFLGDTFFANFLDEYTELTANALIHAADADAKIEAEFRLWWVSTQEYAGKIKPGAVEHDALARAVITGWINRILFCHYLKGYRSEAAAVDGITGAMSVQDGMAVLEAISARCDFMQVFLPEAGARCLPAETWGAIKQLNAFMTELAAGAIQQGVLRLGLERSLAASRRKTRGQFTTPDQLAELVIALGMEDRTGCLLDPCCGTGTIPKAAFAARIARGQSHADALSCIWASDRFQFPLQFTTLALADPAAMDTPLHVFRSDVFDLKPGQRIELANPTDGSPLVLKLPRISTIASNLPFVRFETLARVDPTLRDRFNAAVGPVDIDPKSDLFAYIILAMKRLLVPGGRVCVVVSNAWLSTEWGKRFREFVTEWFDIDAIVTSAAGRWFANSSVVTNILLLKRKEPGDAPRSTRFITTGRKLEDWDTGYIQAIASDVFGHQDSVPPGNGYSIRSYTRADLTQFEKRLIGWSGFFSDISWINELASRLVPARDVFEIARGERRGWDPLFFPEEEHGIESEYIVSVLRNAREVTGLTASPSDDAFCCSRSLDELRKLKHSGALAWIKRFASQTNGIGDLLTTVLATGGREWYEMRTNATADFAVAMNPEDRIFTLRLDKRSFVNQRLIRLSVLGAAADLDLLHALLNSSLAIFFVESSGFGRGLGALDIQPTKLKAGLKLPDPARIPKRARNDIVRAFKSMLARRVLRLDQEMASKDRHALDAAVLGAIGKAHLAPAIRAAVVELYRIRKSVKS